jgi:phage terminase large subunit
MEIYLNRFVPRSYQIPVCSAIATEGGKFRKLLIVMPRRAGKDVMCFNLLIRAAARYIGSYFYCLPTFAQARSVIWDSITNTGERFLDYIPKEMIAKIRNDTMTINLINGSIIRLVGSDSYDTSIVGSNPRMIVFSEYALADENAYKLAALPILKANDGIVMLISTPRGKNSMYDLWQIAKCNPDDWFTYFLTIDDTKHISADEVRKEIESGEVSEDLALQEYWCSFECGQEGSYYAKYIDKLRLKGRIGDIPWDPYSKVHTAWDLGIKDPTCIIFFQTAGESVRIIDYYEASDYGMDHFAKVIQNKPYIYGYHFPPHDIMQRESARGLTKREMYKELGVKFTEPVYIEIEDGIELVRRTFSRLWIDEKNCSKLIKALENYREEFDVKRKVYKGRPLHDFASHGADAMRYMCAALPKTKDGLSQEKIDKIYNEAMYGGTNNMPAIFRDEQDF